MEKIIIGRVQKPFGVKGEVKVHPLTDFVEERFKVGETVYFTLDNKIQMLEMESIRNHQGSLLIKFKGLNNLNDVEFFHQGELSVDASKRHELPENEYYFDELKGMDVYHDDTKLGEVIEVMDMPAHPVLRIQMEEKIIMIPFNNVFIEDVDKESNTIKVHWMEGLF